MQGPGGAFGRKWGRNQRGLPESSGIQADSPRMIDRWVAWQKQEGKKVSKNNSSGGILGEFLGGPVVSTCAFIAVSTV